MAIASAAVPGQTPLDADEASALLPRHIATQSALNEWEQANILRAVQWLHRRRAATVLSEEFCRTLHRHMFDRTWRWAGQFRRSDKNIGCAWPEVPTRLRQLLDNTAYWVANGVFPLDQAAAQLHHQLVWIHLFPNGNGRHARLMADSLLRQHGAAPFSWGAGQRGDAPGATRQRYIAALRAADAGDVAALLAFARS